METFPNWSHVSSILSAFLHLAMRAAKRWLHDFAVTAKFWLDVIGILVPIGAYTFPVCSILYSAKCRKHLTFYARHIGISIGLSKHPMKGVLPNVLEYMRRSCSDFCLRSVRVQRWSYLRVSFPANILPPRRPPEYWMLCPKALIPWSIAVSPPDSRLSWLPRHEFTTRRKQASIPSGTTASGM